MKINWKVRFKNPVFWRNIAISIVLPMLVSVGISWEEVTTWAAFGNLIVQAVSNPVTVVAIICSVWNAINDPTTAGDSDSERVLGYDKPNTSE